MKSNRKRILTAILIAFLSATACLQLNAASVQELMARMPAKNSADADAISQQLLAGGAEAVAAVCAALKPAGEGAVSARYALNALVAYSSAEGRETERALVEQAIIAALGTAQSKEVQAFLIDQLRWIASDDSVPALAALLSNDDLCSPSCRALITLASTDAEKALLKALPKASQSGQVAIVKALGQLETGKAAKPIRKLLKGADGQLQDVALFALANIAADDDDEDLIEEAVESAQGFRKAQFAGYLLHLAARLAENGEEDEALEICEELIEEGGEINSSVPCGALSLMVGIQGAKAFPAILDALKSQNEFMQGAAVELAKQFDDDKHVAQITAIMPELSAIAKLKVVSLLGCMQSSAAEQPLLKALDCPEAPVAEAAARALIKRDAKAAAGKLAGKIAALKISDTEKVELYKSVAPYVEDAAGKTALLKGLSAIRTLDSLKIVSRLVDQPATSSEASLVAVAIAVDALTDVEVIDILEKSAQNIDSPETRDKAMAHVAKLKEMHGLTTVVPDRNDGSFTKLFNEKDLEGWKGLMKAPNDNPYNRAALSADDYAKAQAEADELMNAHWSVKDGVLIFDGKGTSIVTDKDYADFEMFVDWKIQSRGDSGLYLRGYPQVQIWDPNQWKIGSGGLYNNKEHPSKPLVQADNPIGEWNTFYIKMVGEKVTIYLNDVLVVDNVTLENYWKRGEPLLPTGPIELQAHGDEVHFKNIYVREIHTHAAELTQAEVDEGYELLFNGYNLDGWFGNTKAHLVENGELRFEPSLGGGHLYTDKEYGNFVFRFEFKLTPGANNGLGVRTPPQGDPAYVGFELQILDNTAEKYANLEPWQYHGSVYGIIPAELGRLRPVGEWNEQEVIMNGRDVKIILNGDVIVDGNLDEASKNGTMDGKNHPGLKREKGHISFCSHGSLVYFRNIRVKELD
jgi:HEAT repeat protein